MFKNLAQANVDHYNSNPIEHTVLATVFTLCAVVLAKKALKRIAQDARPTNTIPV